MGRTLEVLGGRLRKAAGADSPASIPMRPAAAPAREPDPEPADGPVLVPLTSDDLPGDREGVPHIEVGGPRAQGPGAARSLSRPGWPRPRRRRKSSFNSCPRPSRRRPPSPART